MPAKGVESRQSQGGFAVDCDTGFSRIAWPMQWSAGDGSLSPALGRSMIRKRSTEVLSLITASSVQQTQLAGAGDGLEAIGRLQLGEEVVQVRLDRAHGDDQAPRDLGIRAALRQQEQHFTLARAQRLHERLARRSRGG